MSLFKGSQQNIYDGQNKACRIQKLGKNIVTLLLAGTMAVGVGVSLGACNKKPVDPGTSNTQPGTNPGTDTTNKYSDILKTVLNSSYYNDLIDKKINKKPVAEDAFVGHPVGFLENKGYDVDELLKEDRRCGSLSFIMDDEFYLRCFIMDTTNNYVDCYLLKYDLSKQEKEDLNILFEGNYCQAPLFIQEISKQKSATVVASSKITTKASSALNSSLGEKFGSYIDETNACTPFLIDYSIGEDYDYENFYIFSTTSSSNKYKTQKGKVAKMSFKSGSIDLDNGYFNQPTSNIYFTLNEEPEVKDIVYYVSENVLGTKHETKHENLK